MRYHLALAIWAAFAVSGAVAGDILWDDSHHGGPFEPDNELDVDYAIFANAIRNAGHTIEELNGTPGAITPAALAGIEALFIMDVELALTASELSTIHNFVAQGGGLFVSWEGGTINSRANPILAPYGLSFSGNNDVFDEDLPVDELIPHPVTDGVSAFQIYGAAFVNATGTALQLVTGDDPNLLGVAQGGPKVVALGDSSLFKNLFIGEYDNYQLGLNIANYLSPIPEPATASLLLTCLPFAVYRRKPRAVRNFCAALRK